MKRIRIVGDDSKISIEMVGNKIEDKTPSGLWPSDHAGLAATMKFAVQKDKGGSH